jgi:hypothetical protein
VRLASTDPGDVHVGLAFWGPDFEGTFHYLPDEAMLVLKAWRPTIVVIESFHLHPWRAAAQTWSTMPTPQLIGRIKQLAQDAGAEVFEQTSDLQRLSEQTPYYKRHVETYGKPKNPHEQSALKHGVYFLHMNPKGPNLA